MAKYSEQLINEIEEWVTVNGLIDYGGARLSDYLARFGFDQRTHYRWLANAEYAEAIKRAKEAFRSSLEVEIVKSMANLAKGYEYTQTIKEYKEAKEVKRTTKNIRVEPNVAAGIFLLTNIAPERWQNKQKQEVSGSIGGVQVVVKDEEEKREIESLLEKI